MPRRYLKWLKMAFPALVFRLISTGVRTVTRRSCEQAEAGSDISELASGRARPQSKRIIFQEQMCRHVCACPKIH